MFSGALLKTARPADAVRTGRGDVTQYTLLQKQEIHDGFFSVI